MSKKIKITGIQFLEPEHPDNDTKDERMIIINFDDGKTVNLYPCHNSWEATGLAEYIKAVEPNLKDQFAIWLNQGISFSSWLEYLKEM